jgi:hypothetical protein
MALVISTKQDEEQRHGQAKDLLHPVKSAHHETGD